MKAISLAVFLVAACGGSGGGGGPNGDIDAPPGQEVVDAHEFHDAPPNVPQMLTLSGKTSEQGLSGTSNTAGVTVAAFKTSDDSMLAMTTSDAQGNYTLMVPTGGGVVDGYVKATKSGYVDIYLYPSRPWSADDTTGDINMLTPSNKDFLNTLASGGQQGGKGEVGVGVFDASGNPVAGATIMATPSGGTIRYTGGNGLPSSSATMTGSDGVGFVFNAPEDCTITATKSGMVFHAHVVKARADKFTTTSITP